MFIFILTVDGVWRVWSNWGDCPVTCGGDVSIRTRTCVGPYYLGRNCSGNWSEDRPCGLDPCPSIHFLNFRLSTFFLKNESKKRKHFTCCLQSPCDPVAILS